MPRLKFIIGSEEEIEYERKVRLALEPGSNGVVSLTADGWYILNINPDGTIETCASVSENLGFEVDKHGEVEIYSSLR